jgi:biopolymer transport protein ExbD
MAFGSFSSGGANDRPMAEINMIPLIDVMLVLLVIFIITAPLLTHAVKIDLPRAASSPNQTRPQHVQLSVNAQGEFHWAGERLDRPQLQARLAEAGQQEPQPEVHIRADQATPYQFVAEFLADSAKAGLTRIGFVSDPRDLHAGR